MLAQMQVRKIEETVKGLSESLSEKRKVEVAIGGKGVGSAGGELARIVRHLLELKKIEKQVQEQIEKYKEHLLCELEEEGLKERPITLSIKGVGKVTVQKKDVSVKIEDAKGLYEVLKDEFWKLVSFKALKGLINLACDADKGQEVRKFLVIEEQEEDMVRVSLAR